MSSSQHKLNLYYSPGACSLAPHILLHASGIPFETTNADVRKGFQDKFVALNSKKQVPFLELEPGVVLTEVPAIITLISQRAPEKNLLGESQMDVVRSYEWFNYLSGQMHARRWGVFFRPQRYVDDEKLFPMVKELAMKNINEAFGICEERLANLPAPDEANFRAVDAYLFVFFRWANAFGLDWSKYPKYQERMLKVAQFEAVKKAIETEGINLLKHG